MKKVSVFGQIVSSVFLTASIMPTMTLRGWLSHHALATHTMGPIRLNVPTTNFFLLLAINLIDMEGKTRAGSYFGVRE